MKRLWSRLSVGVASLACGAALFSACAHNDSSLFIKEVLAPQPVVPGSACLYTNDPTQPFVSSGVLDVALSSTYSAFFLIGSQLQSKGDFDRNKTETSRVSIQGATVRITNSAGNELKSFTTLTTTTIDPSASASSPTYSPVGAEILDPDTVTKYAASDARKGRVRLVTYTKFFGVTLGGAHVESDEFEFPIDVCSGCLIYCNPTATSTVPCQYRDFQVECHACEGLGIAACKAVCDACSPPDAGTD